MITRQMVDLFKDLVVFKRNHIKMLLRLSPKIITAMGIRSSAMCCNVELAGRMRPCFCSRCTQSPTETFGTTSNPEDQKGSSMAKCFPHPVLPVLCVTRCEHLLSTLLLYSVQNWRLLGSSPGDPSPTVTDLLQRDTRMKMRTTMTWEIWGI